MKRMHAFAARARVDRALVKSADRIAAARTRLERETADHERLLAAQAVYAHLDSPKEGDDQ